MGCDGIAKGGAASHRADFNLGTAASDSTCAAVRRHMPAAGGRLAQPTSSGSVRSSRRRAILRLALTMRGITRVSHQRLATGSSWEARPGRRWRDAGASRRKRGSARIERVARAAAAGRFSGSATVASRRHVTLGEFIADSPRFVLDISTTSLLSTRRHRSTLARSDRVIAPHSLRAHRLDRRWGGDRLGGARPSTAERNPGGT